jgi:hypothetical protein
MAIFNSYVSLPEATFFNSSHEPSLYIPIISHRWRWQVIADAMFAWARELGAVDFAHWWLDAEQAIQTWHKKARGDVNGIVEKYVYAMLHI